MELYLVPIIAVIALFVAFIVLNIKHNKKQSKPEPKKQKEEIKQEPPKEEPVQKQSNSSVQLTSRPDFSDMLPSKTNNTKQTHSNPTSTLKPLTASKDLQAHDDAYAIKKTHSKGAKLANEFKKLSPEMKSVIMGNVLDKKQD